MQILYSRHPLILQLLFVIAAFIWQARIGMVTVWLTWKKIQNLETFLTTHAGRVLSETTITLLVFFNSQKLHKNE